DSCRHEWEGRGLAADLDGLLAAAAAIERPAGLVYPDHPRFFNPKSMTAELQSALAETGQKVPEDPARLTRVVLDSLALRYASIVRSIEELTGEGVPGIHIVGGGSLNEYLDQATADAAQRPVLAGPAEATATGNLLMQAFAAGRIRSLAEGRERLAAGPFRPRRYEPRQRPGWREAGERYREIEGRYQ
ncbi:MAG TPA: FGGY-family carbohydrate kinase, partial [Vicinamibacteria bacterium]|nr:FGGY-family carbohydrate kinase [Vicinamibacteria bacterium]